jgi:hypothetical protein
MRKDRWLWAILILAAAVRLVGLGERSLTDDECRHYWASRGNVLIANRENTFDPPLFAALLRLQAPSWRAEGWLRLLPCLGGVLAVAAVYYLAGATGSNRHVSRMAAFLLALAPGTIRSSQSLDAGSLILLAGALLPAAFLSALEEGRPRAGALLALLLSASLLTQYGAVWLLLGMALILASRASRGSTATLLRTALALALGGAAALPFYFLSLPEQLRREAPLALAADGLAPAADFLPALRLLVRGAGDFLGSLSFTPPAAAFAFGILALIGLTRLARRRAGAAAATLFLSATGAAAVASLLWRSPFGGIGPMQVVAPLFAICVAAGMETLRDRVGGIPILAALAAIAIGSGGLLVRHHAEPEGGEIRSVARFLELAVEPGDGVFVSRDGVPQFRFYYRGSGARVIYGEETASREDLSEINQVLAEHSEVRRWWLVFSPAWNPVRRGELAGLDPRFVAGESFGSRRAAAYLYLRRDGPARGRRETGAAS